MSDLTDAIYLFFVASLFGLVLLPDWSHAIVIFGAQAFISLAVWIVKRLFHSYVSRRELQDKESKRRLE